MPPLECIDPITGPRLPRLKSYSFQRNAGVDGAIDIVYLDVNGEEIENSYQAAIVVGSAHTAIVDLPLIQIPKDAVGALITVQTADILIGKAGRPTGGVKAGSTPKTLARVGSQWDLGKVQP